MVVEEARCSRVEQEGERVEQRGSPSVARPRPEVQVAERPERTILAVKRTPTTLEREREKEYKKTAIQQLLYFDGDVC